MLTKTIFGASALLSIAAAVPLQQLNKRDTVWTTKIEEDVVTIDVTTTIWLSPGETAPAGAPGHYGHHHHKHTSHITSTVTVEPASSAPAEQSTYVAPSPSQAAPTTWQSQAPSPTSQAPAYSSPAPATSQAPAPAPSGQPSGGGGSDGLTGMAAAGTAYTGDFTWFDDGLGACGITSGPDDHIVAVSEDIFDAYGTANPNDNPLCGLTVTLTGADGSSYPATIVDRCTGCAVSDLDLSHGFFNIVTSNGDGRVSGMHWKFD